MTDYSNGIQYVLEYIDEHIKDTFTIAELAKISMYSVPHFSRVFKHLTTATPMEYVQKRKLHFAAKELICSRCRIIDVAFEYGYESHDVFSRAFKRIYGITPEFYRRYGYCIPDFNALLSQKEHKEKTHMHNVEIVTLPKTYLIGVENRLHVDEWVMDVFERMYEGTFKNAPNRVHPHVEGYDPPYTRASHVLSILNEDGSYNYFAGIEVSSLDESPEGAVTRILPETICAMIGYEGGLDYRPVTDYLYGEWYRSQTYQSGVDRLMPVDTVEYYTPPTHDIYEERIYMPIKPFAYDIKKIEPYTGICYRTVSTDRCKVKDPTFEVMLKWAEDNGLFKEGNVKFEVRYGKLEEKQYYCEIFYRTEKDLSSFKNSEHLQAKEYEGGLYAYTCVLHQKLELDESAFTRMLEKSGKYSPSCGCYEEYVLDKPSLDHYTPINVYERIVRK